jgi:pimeloyl-ACP methyl ester carboxylesterase
MTAVVIAAILLAAAGCTTTPTTATTWRAPVSPSGDATGTTGGTVAWHDCQSEAKSLDSSLPANLVASCGTVEVPADWTTAVNGKDPDGRTLHIALMRIHDTQAGTIKGSVLMNPGGPGGSGVDFVAEIAPRLYGLLLHFDLVGFDPRGVSRSDPVKCMNPQDLDASFGYDPDPVSDASYQGLVALDQRMANGCQAKYGADLKLYSTRQAASDMDAIRIALGESKLTYLGFSYGTLLGAVYAQLFPHNVRAMVLDGAVDPTQDTITASAGQAGGFELAFSNFTGWCNSTPAQCPIAGDARGAVQKAINDARTNPQPGPQGRSATSGWVLLAVVSAMYSQNAWPYLGEAIAGLAHGDTRYLFLLADNYAERNPDGTYSNLFDANAAVSCADSDFPTVAQIRTLQAQWRTKYPTFGATMATGMLGCAVWPAGKDHYPTGPAVGAPPIVVVGTTGDPATPYAGTAKLANMLGTGTVVTWNGQGHTAYPETACIRSAVENYLVSLTVPPKGLTCPAG